MCIDRKVKCCLHKEALRSASRIAWIIVACLTISSCSGSADIKKQSLTDEEYTNIRDSSQLRTFIARARKDSMNINLHKSIWNYYTRLGLFDDLIADAAKTYKDASDSGSWLLASYAAAYMAQAYLFSGIYSEAEYYLEHGREMLERVDNPPPYLSTIFNNVAAIHAIKTSLDYPRAVDELKKSLEILKHYQDTVNACSILCNISTIYALREDTSGIVYARKAYEMSENIKDLNIKTLSQTSYSSMLYLKKDYLEARKVAEEAIYLVEKTSFTRNMSMVYLNYGKIMAALGKTVAARSAYDEAVKYFDEGADESTKIETLLSYGNLYLESKQYDKASEKYKSALAVCTSIQNIEYKYKILKGLSSVYGAAGDTDSAYYYFQLYHQASNTAFNLKKEQQFSDLEKEFLKADHERFEKEAQIKIMRKQRNLIAAMLVIAAALVLLGYFWYFNRKLRRMYDTVVRQYNIYKQRIEDIQVAEEARQKKETEELFGIYNGLEEKMKSEMLFQDRNLSLETCAEKLNTTPVKLSMAVNKYSGMSFPNYINKYRVSYVTDRLSDKDETEQMIQIFKDAGFYSKATAYRCFQKEVGCSPSQYRTAVIRNG